MKQINIIEKIKSVFPNTKGIQVALLYGSFGRMDANPNSDVDIQILIDEDFDKGDFINILKLSFSADIRLINEVGLRNKIVVYFKSMPKVEFSICNKIIEINRNYLGSEIINIGDTILYANDHWKGKINLYLEEITKENKINKTLDFKEIQINDLISKFVYEFENCSTMQRRSDAFQHYFFYNIALHIAVQLKHLAYGETKFNFLPKKFVANTLKTEEQKSFYDLKGSLFLPEANHQKRKLLDFFYASIESLVNADRLQELEQFLEWIFERDYFWNFRDISTHNSIIKSGIVYRTATLTMFQNDSRFEDLLKNRNIKAIVDLRADREIDELPYNEISLTKFKYIKAQLDPWNQPQWYKEKYNYGTNEEIAYRFFGIGCNAEIKTTLESIISQKDGAVAIHCFAGKDRTGILISLLHLLVEAPLDIIFADYLASEVDVKPYRLQMVLDIINEKGGIVPYLINCGLNAEQVDQLKNKLLNGN